MVLQNLAAMKPILYNLTRLISRRASKTATGIDRVELHHAALMAEASARRPVMFLHQAWNTMRPVGLGDAKNLLRKLSARWGGGEREFIRSYPRLESARRTIDGWMGEKLNRTLHPDISRFLRHKRRPIFFNSGQLGANHLRVHEYLGEQHKADLVFYLHDLITIDFPEYVVNPNGADFDHRRVTTMAKTGRIVLANSKYTIGRFRRFCDEHSLAYPETKLLPIGVDDYVLEAAKAPVRPISPRLEKVVGTEPYFVVLGTIEPRKNHLLLLQLWRHMARKYGPHCPRLLIVGQRGWKNEHVVDLLERSRVLESVVIEFNDVADKDMVALLRHARALLFPSFEEGWGMPLVEALTLGTPAICSDIPAFHESGQGRALYLDPLDGKAWLEAILAMIEAGDGHNSPLYTELKDKTRGFRPPTWHDHSEGLLRVIDDLDGLKGPVAVPFD